MPFCPNCSADLKSSDPAQCWNCDAVFTARDGWKPTQAPVGTFRKWPRRVSDATAAAEPAAEAEPPRSASWAEIVVRGVLAAPILGAGLLLMVFATGQLGAIAGIPALICLAVALGLFFSRSPVATAIAGACAGLIYLLLFAVEQIF